MKYVKFSLIDYALFVIMFGLSGAVGIYFGCCGKQDTTKDYLHGGKKMKVFPVAMSLVASTLSAVALVSIPAEVYMYGTQYWVMVLAIFLLGFVVNNIYLPVFYKLQLTSVYEYLEIRFDRNIRIIVSAMSTFASFVCLPVFIYAPSLAFNQMTGFNLHLIALIMSLICILYTTIGGIKAVVWTDTLQFCVTLCTLGLVLVMGTLSVGGVRAVWEKAGHGNRLEFFNMDLDPTVRSTFWSIVLGSLYVWTSFVGTSQATVQRFLSVPTYNDSKKILMVFIIITIITKSAGCFSGLIIYAKYFDCDPLTAGLIKKPDQILPYYVSDVAAHIPGISGLFVAGLFSAALSTLSTFINSLAGTMYEDLIAPFMPPTTSERKASTIMKLLTLLIGLISVSLVFVVERLGSILQLLLSLNGITGGPIFGLFTIGMLFPFVNKKGALWGVLGALFCMSVIVGKNQFLIWNGTIKATSKPLYTYGCNTTSNSSSFSSDRSVWTTTTDYSNIVGHSLKEPLWLFTVSFYYYTLIGTMLTLIIGLVASWATKSSNDVPVNYNLFSPCIHRFLPKFTAPAPDAQEMQAVKMTNSDVELEEPFLDKLLKQ